MINNSALPVHIGIIMDGNGRWAKKRNLPRTSGHKEGLTTAKNIIKAASELGIKYVTLYTFSTENWKRAEEEVGYLMSLIKVHLRAEFEFYKKNGIKIKHIGDLNGLSEDVRKEIENAQKETENFNGTTVVLAINYGGRDEIIRAIKKLDKEEITNLTEKDFSKKLDIAELPDVDLMIRTGGEERISNFLIWQCAYSEFVFSNKFWPDYTVDDFYNDIEIYQQRTRRFGAVL